MRFHLKVFLQTEPRTSEGCEVMNPVITCCSRQLLLMCFCSSSLPMPFQILQIFSFIVPSLHLSITPLLVLRTPLISHFSFQPPPHFSPALRLSFTPALSGLTTAGTAHEVSAQLGGGHVVPIFQ